jgi:PDZ domain-containing protein
MRRRRIVRTWIAILLTVSVAAARRSVLAQDAPPPVKETKKEKEKEKAEKEKPGKGQSTAGPAGTPQAPPTLLLSTDLPCSVSVDDKSVVKLTAKEMRPISIGPGQHILAATSEDGRLRWTQVVEAKPGQQVVQISLATAGLIYSDADFDRTMAGVWLGISDLKVAGAYASSILNRSWGFHNQTLSTALHTAHTYLKDQIEDLKKIAPSDAERKRMAEEVLQLAPNADKYIDLMTKAIAKAQEGNTWMGEASDMYAQARALEPTIVFPSNAIDLMRKSESFKGALPIDRQVTLGLASDPRDFNLGAEYYQSTPSVLAVVAKGGPADKLGFRAGDRVLSADGQPVKSVRDLKLALRANAGKTIRVVLERQGQQQQRDIKVPGELR